MADTFDERARKLLAREASPHHDTARRVAAIAAEFRAVHREALEECKAREAELRTVVSACAELFRQYERHHAAKPDMEKAARNASMADMCERALMEPEKEGR